MKQTDSYVIGTSLNALLHIEFGADLRTGKSVVNRVVYGMIHVDEATIIPGKENAFETLQEIKDRRETISVVAPTILESCVNPDGIDVDKLRIYEVRVGWEVH